MSRLKIKTPPIRFTIAATVVLPMMLLTSCSEYLDRRDTIVESGGNALASNAITQMVDPWPAVSRDRNIPFNGQRMQAAVARYRTNKVTPPGSATANSASNQTSTASKP